MKKIPLIFNSLLALLLISGNAFGQSLATQNHLPDKEWLAFEEAPPLDRNRPEQQWIMAPPTYIFDTDQLLFNWQQRSSINTPQAMEFRLYELPKYWRVEEIINRKKPVYQIEVNTPKVLLDLGEMELKPGKRYAYLVLPASATEEDWLARFPEEMLPFTFLPDCTPPEWMDLELDGSDLKVTWERPEVVQEKISYTLAYRMRFSDDFFSAWEEHLITGTNTYVIRDLSPGKEYEVQLRKNCVGGEAALESDWMTTAPVQIPTILRGGGACDQLQSGSVAGSSNGIAVTWFGPPAEPLTINYNVRYRNVTNNESDWTVIRVLQGEDYLINNLVGNHNYEIEIRLILLGSQGSADIVCDWINLGLATAGVPSDGGGGVIPPEEEDLEVELPPFNCGDLFEIPTVDNTTFLATADTGDVFWIGGFPVKIKQINGGNGLFSGEGLIPIPFGEKMVRVRFNNISVNEKAEVFAGTMESIDDDPANYPLLNTGTINLGGDFCVEPPTQEGFNGEGVWVPTGLPWNPQGFGSTGTYDQQPPYPGYQQGNPFDPNYDPNGYDSGGVHVETGTIYNPAGCSQVGLDINGQPCDPSGEGPYYWLDGETGGGSPTEGGIELANNTAPLIRGMIEQALEDLLEESRDSVNAKRLECDGIRTGMQTLVSNLGYERPFLFGPNDEYFSEGMHQNFSEEPETLGIFLDRNPAEEELEEKHVDLYGCDKRLYVFLDWEKVILEQQESAEVDAYEAQLLDLISRFTEVEVQQYTDPAAMAEWVYQQIDREVSLLLQAILGDAGLFPIPHLNKKYPNPHSEASWSYKAQAPDYTQMLAGLDFDGFASGETGSPNGKSLEDISFEFRQGWKYIGGIHRAFYLEAIAKERREGTAVLNDPNPYLAPIELPKVVAGRNQTIYLDKFVFTPTGASLNAYFVLEIPTSGDRLVFELTNLGFGTTGADKGGEGSRLKLGTAVEVRLSNAARLRILPGDDTYIAWDCEGFDGMSIAADIEFCRKYVVPIHPVSLEEIEDENVFVTAHFIAEMPAWGEFIANLDIDPFLLPEISDVKWEVSGAKLDMSDAQNAPGIKFPDNYTSPFVNGNVASNLWKGFYLNSLTATMPNKFNDQDGSQTVGVQDVIIDDMGFTGKAFVSSLLDLAQGDLGGWAFSVENFSLTVTTNKLTGASFDGLVHLPILGQKDGDPNAAPTPEECLAYEGKIEAGNNYSFVVSSIGEYYADIWKARVVIDDGSKLTITSAGDNFEAKALLNGRVEINGDFGAGKILSIPDITFEGLGINNTAPYFTPGKWGFPNAVGAELAGFGIKFKDIVVNQGNYAGDEASLNFITELRLNDEEGESSEEDSEGARLKATGHMTLIGELHMVNGRQRWRYKDFNLNSFSLEGSMPGVDHLKGSLSFYEDDVVFGKGFRGLLEVKFKGMKGVKLDAVAQFGKMPDYKYFMIDALAVFDEGIEMGGLQLLGFGGGVYNKMTQSDPGTLPDGPTGTPSMPELGESTSGITYRPNKTTGLGLQATAVLATSASKKAFNCNATLGMEFNGTGGLNNIYFKGNGRFMSDVIISAPPTSGSPEANPLNGAVASAFVDISYDFNNKVLDGNFSAYLNVGNGLITGSMNNYGKMGQVVLHFAPNDWYVNIGTPSERCGLKLSVPGLGDVLKLSAYLDVGNNVPDMPPLPAYVSEITGASSMGASPGLRHSGRGFAFGADFSMDTGDLQFLVFYASFQAGLGFDMMLMDYGADAQCSNTNNGKIGINGWYASGQAWAYVQGDVGLRARIFGRERRFSILSLGAGVALQAKLPNPFWAQGNVGGHYSVLGGLLKGRCNFQITVGKTCDVVGDPPQVDLPIIESLSPFDGSTHQSTLTKPTANFIVPLTQTYTLENVNHSLELAYARLLTADGSEIPGKVTMDDLGSRLEFNPHFELPMREDFVFEVKVNVLRGGTVVDFDEKSITFRTDFRDSYIPTSNVVASYPMNGQYNFYPNENPSGKGYILLEIGQPDLFYNVPPNSSLMVFVYRTNGNLAWFTSDIEYNAANNEISFPLRPGLMPNGEVVELQLVYMHQGGCLDCMEADHGLFDNSGVPPIPRPAIENSETSNNSGIGLGGTSGELNTDISVEGNTYEIVDPTVLYRSFFRVSEYDTFAEKMAVFANQHTSTYDEHSKKITATAPSGFELLDPIEAGSFGMDKGLVSISGELSHTAWYTNNLANGLYANFPIAYPVRFSSTIRDANNFEQELRNAVDISFPYGEDLVSISEADFQSGDLSRFSDQQTNIAYDIPYLVRLDWKDLKDQVAEYVRNYVTIPANGDPEEEERLYNQEYVRIMPQFMKDVYEEKVLYPNPVHGVYKINLNYELPGKNQTTSNFSINLNY